MSSLSMPGSGTMQMVSLLQACGSDQRAAAEVALKTSEDTNPAVFMLTCAEVLRDQRIAPDIRSLAAILLKNAIGSRDVVRGKELTLRWLAVDEATKVRVRSSMLDALSDANHSGVRRAAGLCIARIGTVDIPAGRWPQAVPSLVSLVTGSPPEVACSVLWTCGELADEWTYRRPKEVEYAEVADQLFVMSVRALQEPCPSVRAAAATALSHLMQWTVHRKQRDSPEETVALLQLVLGNCAASQAEHPRIQALACLAACTKQGYIHMAPVLEEFASCALAAIDSSSDEITFAGIAVWHTIAEHEGYLEPIHKRKTAAQCAKPAYHQAVRRVQAALVPALLGALVRGAQAATDAENDGSNLLHVATDCFEHVGRVLGDESIVFVRRFLDSSARTSSCHCRAALAALGAIQCSTSTDGMETMMHGVMPFLIEVFKSGTSGLAASAAWAAGAIAEHHLEILTLSSQEAIYLLCVEKLSCDELLTVQVCYCLDMLLVKQSAKMPASFFEEITGKLVSGALRATTDRARASLLGTVGEMVKLAEDDCIEHMVSLLSQLLSWAEKSGGRPVEGVAPCLRTLTLRLGVRDVSPAAEKMFKVYIGALEAHFAERGYLDAETLRAAGALSAVLGLQFESALPTLWPVLTKALADIDEPDVCLAGLAAFQDVIRGLGPKVQPYVAEALEIAFRGLRHRESLCMRLRIEFIGCIADMIKAVGAALPALLDVLRILGEEVAYIHERQSETALEISSSANKDHGDAINMILRAYEAVVGSLNGSEGNLSALGEFILGVLEFVCCFARAMQTHVTNASWNLGVVLVGRIAQGFPEDLAGLASRSHEVQSLIKDLHRISCETPDALGGAELRPFTASLASVLQASLASR